MKLFILDAEALEGLVAHELLQHLKEERAKKREEGAQRMVRGEIAKVKEGTPLHGPEWWTYAGGKAKTSLAGTRGPPADKTYAERA